MRIFISYSRADTESFAKQLADWLRQHGHEPWLDIEKGIPHGHPFDVRIEVGIQGSGILLALLSPWSVRPESFCRNEILYAQSQKKTILPVRIADVVPPIQIISLNYIDASSCPEDIFKLLPAALETIECTGMWQHYPVSAGKSWYEPSYTLSFQEELVRHSQGFVGREWLFTELKNWISDPKSRVFLLIGDAGIGKSAIAAQMTTKLDVKGVHFCSKSNVESCRPVAWIQALINQLVRQFPQYQKILDQIPAPDWSNPPVSLFRTLVSDRLDACKENLTVTEPWVFVIDGLDEADREMVTFLAETVTRIPPWIRLVITSRPDSIILSGFIHPGVQIRHINAEDPQNLTDVDTFLQQQYDNLDVKNTPQETSDILERLKTRTAGNFLYASMLMKSLGDKEYQLSFADIGSLPTQLGTFYNLMFRGRFSNPAQYKHKVRPLLDCLTAASTPVSESLLIAATGISKSEAYEGLHTLSQFLIHDRGEYWLFHESLKVWLTDNPAGNPFAAYPDEGNRRLTDACWREVIGPERPLSTYTLLWLPIHLMNFHRTDDLAALLANPRYFKPLWDMSDEIARKIWVVVERDTSLRMENVYSPVIWNPGQYPDDFIFNVARLLNLAGHPQEALPLFEYREKKAQMDGDLKQVAESLNLQALILRAQGDPDGAMARHKDVEKIYRELGDKNGLATSLNNQANIRNLRGDLDGAMILYKEAERLCRELGNQNGLKAGLGNQARILYVRGDLDGAMLLFKERERICRELGNQDGLQSCLGNQANILKDRGDLDGAMTLHKKAEEICRELGNKQGLQISIGNQARILCDRGDIDEAMTLLKDQERICRELGNTHGLQESYGNQARILCDRGDIDEAMTLLKDQERICRELGNKNGLQESLGNQARILKDRGNLDGAMALLKEQEWICRELGNKYGLATSLNRQALIIADGLNNCRAALLLIEEAYQIADSCGFEVLKQTLFPDLERIRLKVQDLLQQ